MATRPTLAAAPEPRPRSSEARPRLVRFDGGEGSGTAASAAPSVALMGVWIALVPVLMLFLAFTSAYIVRQGLGQDWTPVALPGIVWLNTAVLALSSVALELGRRREGRVWLGLALALGVAFLAGQVAAWLELVGRGVHLGTTAHGSFFYVFTGTHAAHLIAGVLGLMAASLWPASGWLRTPRPTALAAAAVYWHFMGLVWIGILCLLTIGR